MNYKRSLIGVLVVVCGGLAGCDEKKGKDDFGILHNHDEPVIIENGSVKMNLNFGDGADAIGHLYGGGHYFIRENAPHVKKIRVFTAVPGGKLEEQFCLGVPCKKKGLTGGLLIAGIGRDAGEPSTVTFSWKKGGGPGFHMFSPVEPFQPESGHPFRLFANKTASGKDLGLDSVSFEFYGQPIKFDRPPDQGGVKGQLKVEICVKEDETKCP